MNNDSVFLYRLRGKKALHEFITVTKITIAEMVNLLPGLLFYLMSLAVI